MKQLRIVVLISGHGSNLQAIIDAIRDGDLPVEIAAVISNRADALGVHRAERAHIPVKVIVHQEYASRDDFDDALMQQIDQYGPDLVVLAGFMRRLGRDLVRHYQGRLVNIHPSLLPKYPGLHTHRRVLEAGDAEHGATIHYVTEEVDGGPIISQVRSAVLDDDTQESLKQRVQQLEYVLYPRVLRWFAQNRLKLDDNRVFFDGVPASKTGVSE